MENEFRFLIEDEKNKHKIGEIRHVYFGAPYKFLNNSNEISQLECIKKYNDIKDRLMKLLEHEGIEYSDVYVKNDEIVNVEEQW